MMKLRMFGHPSLQLLGGGASYVCGARLPSEVADLVLEEFALRAFAHTQDPGD